MAPKKAAKEVKPDEDYDTWSIPQLKARLQELGATASGSKAVLLERVKALSAAVAPASAEPKRGAAKSKAKAATEVAEAAPARGKAPAKAKSEAAPAAREAPAKATGKAKAAATAREPPPKANAEAAANAPLPSKAPAAGKRGAAAAQDAPATKRPKAAAASKAAKDDGKEQQIAESDPAVNISGPSDTHFENGDFCAEYAKSNRSACVKCKEKIPNGALRIGKKVPSDKFDGMYTVWQHWPCMVSGGALPLTTAIISGFSTLRPEDQDIISERIPSASGPGGAGGDEGASEEVKQQSKRVFEVLDMLKELSDNQIKDMLLLNDYPYQKLGDKAATKQQLCADGILFGACDKCEVCGGSLLLSGDGYRCNGWVNAFLKCNFKTQTPGRSTWALTDAAKGAANGKLGKMKLKTDSRLFISEMRDDEEIAASQEAPQKKPVFLGLTMVVLEKGECESKEALEQMIKSNGGSVADAVTKAAECVVTCEEVAEQEGNVEVAKAKQHSVVGVSEEFVKDSIETGELQDISEYLLWGERKRRKIQEAQTSRFIEKQGVSMDADVGDMAQTAHILVDRQKRLVYSEMLTRTDLVSGSNSFYTLHLLESDASEDTKYWVFRKWGRIGVSQGGTKLEEFGTNKNQAINNFRKQYFEKTGNEFGEPFDVRPGKFVRVEVEHKALSKKAHASEGQSSGGAGSEKGAGDQPLGKLSKAQIEKGDAVLDKLEPLIADGAGAAVASDPAVKATMAAQLIALSAEFYTLIPHNFGTKKPPIINNMELFGSEKALLQFYLRMGFEDMGVDDDKLTPIAGVMQFALPSSLKVAASEVCAVKDITSCTTKGAKMHKGKAGKPHTPMSPDLYGAILLYTSNAIYKQLNKALRDEDRRVVETYFPYLRMLFEACARLPQQRRTLWRGIGVDLYEQYKVGTTIIWWGVSSCTSDEKVAKTFMAGCGDGATLLTVETLTACDISEVSFFQNEAESILLPGTQLEVLSSKKVGKKSEISLREVGRVVN